jgi:hypothetical protein
VEESKEFGMMLEFEDDMTSDCRLAAGHQKLLHCIQVVVGNMALGLIPGLDVAVEDSSLLDPVLVDTMLGSGLGLAAAGVVGNIQTVRQAGLDGTDVSALQPRTFLEVSLVDSILAEAHTAAAAPLLVCSCSQLPDLLVLVLALG